MSEDLNRRVVAFLRSLDRGQRVTAETATAKADQEAFLFSQRHGLFRSMMEGPVVSTIGAEFIRRVEGDAS